MERMGTEQPSTSIAAVLKERTISERLQIIFNLPGKETVYHEWPCCMVRSAIVPGMLYLTEKHICFYASLPQSPEGRREKRAQHLLTSGHYLVACAPSHSMVIGNPDTYLRGILAKRRLASTAAISSSKITP
ncbi:hypothetical protein BX666DRAFT_469869 [Dichotomocladium elegans]|nr:hypothetical protein BX666DRAFT_469869 [Dichotomocladium elegans]